ncbi:MAG: class I SAM-dependent methyltransferase, partial [Waterburya sp.]
GFEQGISRNLDFFQKHNISPIKSGIAVDLGAGCGFQSIPLAQLGFVVTAIDLNTKLLNELQANTGKLTITTIEDDLLNFEQYLDTKAELIVCMTDTILHLESKDIVTSLFQKVFSSLENDGKFIITFRDLSSELSELERFIPVRSDEQTIFTCFLEYEPNTVKVHDLVYQKDNNAWKLNKNFYRKLRLSQQWVNQQLVDIGFSNIESNLEKGLVTVVATR